MAMECGLVELYIVLAKCMRKGLYAKNYKKVKTESVTTYTPVIPIESFLNDSIIKVLLSSAIFFTNIGVLLQHLVLFIILLIVFYQLPKM
jgi:hypothetical protein